MVEICLKEWYYNLTRVCINGDCDYSFGIHAKNSFKEDIMKHKLLRRVLASVMALLLVIGLLPTTFVGGGIKVSADDGAHEISV